MFYWCLSTAETYGGQESCNFRKHMQIEKHQQIKKIFSSVCQQMVQMLTTQTNKHTHCKCSQHKQIKKHAANAHNTTKYILFAARLFVDCVVSICSMCVVKMTKVVFLICRVFFRFATRFFFWLCCEHLQHVRCQFDESFFLICSALSSLGHCRNTDWGIKWDIHSCLFCVKNSSKEIKLMLFSAVWTEAFIHRAVVPHQRAP